MSLANKYRPRNFDTIIGQDHITGILKAKIKSDKGGNSNFLLFGPRGTGKTSCARILAKAMNCLDLQDGNPCNQCANCKTIDEGKTLDYVEIDAASHTGVDNIRDEIISKAVYPPTMLKKKIYVIDEVHMLSKGAFNALLKTIEEPRDTVAFILATTEVNKVPETVISRCQVFNFKKVPEAEMVGRLEEICKSEGLSYDDNALSLIAKVSEGCVRDAVKYVDQVSILGNLNEENVTKFLGIASEQTIINFIDHIVDKNSDLLFKEIAKLVDQGVDLQHFAKQVLMFLDAHLFDNIDLYLKISEQFGEILSGIRNYPYPALIYKIVLHKYIHGTSGSIVEPVAVEKPVAATNPDPVQKIIVQEEKIAPVQAKIATDSPSQSTDLWTRVVARIDKDSLQKSLKDLSSISSLENGVAHIMVINKFAQMALESHENRNYIEKLLSEEHGSPIQIKVEFQSKEDFFSGMLG
ncbi:DNA polymerase III, gamma and tau subunit [candidate division SR1 bacterium RAAC1_SR1_1]|nr:DNA polymerase III, gamma and tau subunit [candidate division SR1 bacterium RAAC1_SR1_1]